MRDLWHLSLLCAAALPAFSQTGSAELSGTVRDPSGLPVPGVRIELSHRPTHTSRQTTTSATGRYRLLALPPGDYDLLAAHPRFQTVRRLNLQLRVDDHPEFDLTLPLGEVASTVQVKAAVPLLNTTSATVSTLITEKQATALPLDGRNFVPLIALAPGVMLPPGQLLPRINGSRPRTSQYLYDGISVLQPEPGQVAYYPVLDAIEEFRVQTNTYSAEYGRSNGGIIQVVTKSGAAEFHGTLFEFLRNEILNARNLFAPPGPPLPFKRNQYGFTLGGPVQRRKSTFFFVDWQGTRLRTGVTRFSTVPTSGQRQAVFANTIFDPATDQRLPFPGNTIPLSRWDPTARALLARYPLPNVFTASGAEASANNYRRSGTDSTNADQFDTRLDRYFASRDRLFARYSFLRDDSTPVTPLPEGSGNITTSLIAPSLTRADSVVADNTWTLSPATVQETRFGFTRRALHRDALPLPVYDLTGLQQLGPPATATAALTTSVTQLAATLYADRAAHRLAFGIELGQERLDAMQPANPLGYYQFTPVLTSGLSPTAQLIPGTGNALASFLLGQVQTYSIDLQSQVLQPRATIAEAFVQDNWRVSPRLNVNLGVRYTLNFPSTEAHNRSAVFNLRTQQLDYAGVNGVPRSARNLEWGDLGPRLGIVYRLAPNTVARAGYGLTWIEQAGITTPFTTPLFPFIQSVSQNSTDNRTPAFLLSAGPSVSAAPLGPDAGLGQGVFAVQRDNGSGYAQQWNLSLQHTMGTAWSFELGYLGSKLTRLGVPDVNLNQLRVEQLALGAPILPVQQLLRPYPRFNTVALYRNNTGNSTYHSLQARLERRLSRGLTVSASYTFSKLIDDAGAVFDSAILSGPVINYQAADSFSRRLEKDESTGSIPHVFAASWVWDLPFFRRWELAGVVRAQSGMPFAVIQATNYNAPFGFGIQRPNRIANPELPGDQRTLARYFNTAAFTTAPQFTIGNSSRNPVRGPGYQAADLMLSRAFTITEHVRAEFRAECFNLTNTPPLGQPNGSFGSPAFGTITTALDPRVFELALKVRF